MHKGNCLQFCGSFLRFLPGKAGGRRRGEERRSNLGRRQVTIWRLHWQALCTDCQDVPLFASSQRQWQEEGMKSSMIVTSAVNKNSPFQARNQSQGCSIKNEQTGWGGGIEWAAFFFSLRVVGKKDIYQEKEWELKSGGEKKTLTNQAVPTR